MPGSAKGGAHLLASSLFWNRPCEALALRDGVDRRDAGTARSARVPGRVLAIECHPIERLANGSSSQQRTLGHARAPDAVTTPPGACALRCLALASLFRLFAVTISLRRVRLPFTMFKRYVLMVMRVIPYGMTPHYL